MDPEVELAQVLNVRLILFLICFQDGVWSKQVAGRIKDLKNLSVV